MENYYMVYNNLKKFLAEDWIFLFVELAFVGEVWDGKGGLFLFFFRAGWATKLIWYEIQPLAPWCGSCVCGGWMLQGFAFPAQPGALSASRQVGESLFVAAARGGGQAVQVRMQKHLGSRENIYLDDGAGAGSLSL